MEWGIVIFKVRRAPTAAVAVAVAAFASVTVMRPPTRTPAHLPTSLCRSNTRG